MTSTFAYQEWITSKCFKGAIPFWPVSVLKLQILAPFKLSQWLTGFCSWRTPAKHLPSLFMPTHQDTAPSPQSAPKAWYYKPGKNTLDIREKRSHQQVNNIRPMRGTSSSGTRRPELPSTCLVVPQKTSRLDWQEIERSASWPFLPCTAHPGSLCGLLCFLMFLGVSSKPSLIFF